MPDCVAISMISFSDLFISPFFQVQTNWVTPMRAKAKLISFSSYPICRENDPLFYVYTRVVFSCHFPFQCASGSPIS